MLCDGWTCNNCWNPAFYPMRKSCHLVITYNCLDIILLTATFSAIVKLYFLLTKKDPQCSLGINLLVEQILTNKQKNKFLLSFTKSFH